MRRFQAWGFIAFLGIAACPLWPLAAAPAAGESKASVSAEEYVVLGAFQPQEGLLRLGMPEDLWRDAQGNFHVLEFSSVQSFDATGKSLQNIFLKDPTDTWFGGFNHLSHDKAGNLYGADASRNQIVVFGPDGRLIRRFGTVGDGDGELYFPEDAAINPQGHVVVTDMFNHRLAVWTTDGHWLRGIPLPTLIQDAQTLKIDAHGHIFVLGHGLFELDAQGKYLRTVVKPQHQSNDGGLYSPTGFALGPDGSFYVIDYTPGGSRIVKFNAQGQRVSYIGISNGVTFSRLAGLWVDTKGIVYAADNDNQRILVFAPAQTRGKTRVVAQTTLVPLVSVLPPPRVAHPEYVFDRQFGGDQKAAVWILFPSAVALDAQGNVYVSGRGGVTEWTADGQYLKSFAEPKRTASNTEASSALQFAKLILPPPSVVDTTDRGDITGITLDKHGNLFASYSLKPVIVRWNADGSPPAILFLGTQGGSTVSPAGIAVDSQDRLYITNFYQNEIERYDETGKFLDVFGPSAQQQYYAEISGIAIDDHDSVFVSTRGGNVTKLDTSGKAVWNIGRAGRQFGEFDQPFFLTTDHQSNLFVADSGNGRIQKFDPDGVFLTSFGEPNLDPAANTEQQNLLGRPAGLAVNSKGIFYAANRGRVLIYRSVSVPADAKL